MTPYADRLERMTRITIGTFLGAIIAALGATAPADAAEARIELTSFKVDIRGGTYTLEAAVGRPPNGNGPWPLVLVTHGSPRNADDRSKVRPVDMLAQARDMAHRGWISVAIVRRGFGASGQPFVEGYNCGAPDYRRALSVAADDVAAIHAVVKTWPEVDATRVLGMGVSVGGAAMLAWAATQPSGLLGIVNVSGGTGAYAPRVNCDENSLISAFGLYGGRARVASLWFYAENDSYWPPDLVRRMHAAYLQDGGIAALHMFGPVSGDGHDIWYLSEGRRLWLPLVDEFLRERKLPTWEVGPANLFAQTLGSDARRVLNAYLAWPTEKALAVSRTKKLVRFWGHQAGLDEAKKGSIAECEKDAGEACDVAMENFMALPLRQ